jgi:hypothetical protein
MEFRRIQETSERPGFAPEGAFSVNSSLVRYIDVRSDPPEVIPSKIDQYFSDQQPDQNGLKGVAVALPQSSSALALSLAARGIFLMVGAASESLEAVLERCRAQMEFIAAAGSRAAGFTPSARSPDLSPRSRTQSPYAQKPAHFDEAAYREWMGLLSKPWHEEDAWKSET